MQLNGLPAAPDLGSALVGAVIGILFMHFRSVLASIAKHGVHFRHALKQSKCDACTNASAEGATTIRLDVNASAAAPIVAPRPVRPVPIAGPSLALVGSGPGNPDLLTVAALKELQAADLVVADRLIPAAMLKAVVPPRAELFIARKTKGNADPAQHELEQKALTALRQGRRVVRLKEGDPFVFGRGGDEVLFFRQQGFEPRLVPGISSCIAAPLAAGIPVTHRALATELCVATAVLKGGDVAGLPEHAPHRTTVLLMGVARLPTLARDLYARGYPPSLPAAIIEKATHADAQRVFRCDIASLASVAAENAVRSPAVITLGHVVNAVPPAPKA